MIRKIAVLIFAMLLCSTFAIAADQTAPAKGEKEYISDLSSDDEALVLSAADWLGAQKSKNAVASLLPLLKTGKSESIRINAAVALGLIGDKTSAEPITEAILSEGSADVRYAEVLAVSRIGIDNTKSYDNLMAARDKESDPFIKDFVVKMEEKFKGK